MNDKTNYQNNPLHGVSLNKLITILSEHYGFEILYAYLNINCFKTNPSIESSEKFLKKTDWAREKVEGFYLYEYKSLPRASAKEFELSPRDRTIPQDQIPGEPKELSLEDAERLREKRAQKAAEHGNGIGYRHGKKFGNEKSSKSRSAYNNTSSGADRFNTQKPKTDKPFSGNSYSSSFKDDNKVEPKDEKKSDGRATDTNTTNDNSDPWAKWK
jgi:uncharacterized protein (DUF2132 family)